jgi:energy-coupling factor transport system permease protein
VVFGQSQATGGAGWSLPDIQLNLGWLGELHLLGFVSVDSIVAGFTDGLRLAAIILAVAMASQLVSARALLRHTPAALYELSTAVSISVNLAPQLIKSLARVRQARLLRGRSSKISLLASIVIPVLEDTIDQSLALAASMDARGFGFLTGRSKLRALLGSAFVLVAIGVYLLLTGITWAAYLTIGLALASTALVIRAAARSSVRTVAHPLVWSLADRLVLVGLAGLIVLRIAGWWQP